jgi:thymidylate synthase (FAD)
MMTEWYWSGTLYAFARVCNLRLDKSAQKETQVVAELISLQAKAIFPISWKYLTENN